MYLFFGRVEGGGTLYPPDFKGEAEIYDTSDRRR
jgi:hypothetical protein